MPDRDQNRVAFTKCTNKLLGLMHLAIIDIGAESVSFEKRL